MTQNTAFRHTIVSTSSALATCMALLALLWLGAATPVRASSAIRYVAPTGTDTGDCKQPANPCRTIQYAVNVSSAGDEIHLAPGVYNEIVSIAKDLSLKGAGARSSIVDGGGSNSVFYINANVTMSGLTIRHGSSTWGAGIYINFSSALTLSQSAVFSNVATSGAGGIFNNGALTIHDSTVINNRATAGDIGGIFNRGALTIVNSSIMSNTAAGHGGGIYNESGTLTLVNSTVSGNQANEVSANGGGIYNIATAVLTNVTISGNTSNSTWGAGGGIHNQGAMTLTNVTVSGNMAPSGGGIINTGYHTLTIINSTIASNMVSAGSPYPGGIQNYSTVTFKNTILAHNQNANCGNTASLTSKGHNLDSGATCGFSASGDINNSNPLLGPLQYNGGHTYTHALRKGSPAIDAGANNGCPSTDQRGVIRPLDGDANGSAVCDIGAYEYYEARKLYLPLALAD